MEDAELQAIRATSQSFQFGEDEPKPVLLVLDVQLSKERTCAGMRLNRPEYTSRFKCPPAELKAKSDTLLLPDGTDVLIQGVEEVYKEARSTTFTVIRALQLNDWSKTK